MADKILEVKDLNVSFPTTMETFHAVKNVSFHLNRGETLSVIGESGSGKSVTTSAILQLLDKPGRIDSGEILYYTDGSKVDITTLHPRSEEMRNLRRFNFSLVSQEPMAALSPVHTVGDQIKEVLCLVDPGITKQVAHERAIELLTQVQMPEPESLINKYSFQLSGGQRQRVVIAMAIASRPDVLIADEPTTALDVTTQAEILELFAKLQQEIGMAILFITHDLGVVAQISDRVVVMEKGVVVEQGDVRQIFERPEHPYTIKLMNATRALELPSEVKKPFVYTGQTPLLDVHNVTKVFEKPGKMFEKKQFMTAVNNATLTLHPGESLGIVGESGSGKSTLGRAILGMQPATSGNIRYVDESSDVELELADYKRVKRDPLFADLRLIFQDPWSSLNPRMTVADIIEEPLKLLRTEMSAQERKDRVRNMMRRVGLPAEFSSRYPHAFSGGQRQRIVIARALVTIPKLIIADEATAALDVSLRAQVLDLLIEFQNEFGTSFILITHDIATVKYFCDRVIVLQHGTIMEQGTIEQVIHNPQEPYTQKLIAAVPVAELPKEVA
ncbi:dipeptide ABC transporter ATP-binding protein [Vibrio natriegens]|uniref:ABC transporter ATP-binding protein n=1 Tax=Vibrio natriegens NBRC 15636 = ATCC 14048 = DSM 759 TaxID=1219067 RepID=A0AAN0Y713_VIBNA|nr:ABC transporter ATP-binding protein [Vibrio natriegens]ALR17488.1 ABC transporter ATPase [Vibrio natriegens NBRC 15636 = ATCC 14048 = DSM 759]ANQ14979.1 ABC transporter ATP-binding protein [Vibrio natriegens NBRC 15636 = ATCC 14048 = DSM 759]EPM39962.1 ABC transporter ATPase [Vibrio natriegens NBRC 15636 = ATCC 14048 = DSM 759]MDX6029692.1 ABC transporter ATP-binding protein [Vibrio natriegens NBRC 15636 = ATCC 14048 = DSM 759]UUI13619.1 ABC transporter ATP-binding protein [Vibrio natriegen